MNYVIINCFSLDFQLVAEQAECLGSEKLVGYFKNVGSCASACRNQSEMFIYGINKHGVDRCWHADGCNCMCQYDTTNFKCDTQSLHHGYDLYKFEGEIIEIIMNWLYEC